MTSSATRLSLGLVSGSGSLWNMTHRLQVTTFIGAGGKTTCLKTLAHEIESLGFPVVATTTTKVYPEDHMILWKNLNPPPQKAQGAWFWYDRTEDETGKWIGPPVTAVDEGIAVDNLRQRYWVIEGDGARGHKLKCWESYEPQIPKLTDCAVLVSDRGLWGRTLQSEDIHRYHRCMDLPGDVWNAESAWHYFLKSPVFASQYAHMSWVILFNGSGKDLVKESVNDPRSSLDILKDLSGRWKDIKQNSIAAKRPKHLRIAAGDAKEGELQWFDLW